MKMFECTEELKNKLKKIKVVISAIILVLLNFNKFTLYQLRIQFVKNNIKSLAKTVKI